MPLRRGIAYGVTGGSGETYAALVLTNDGWNEHMLEVGVVPLRAQSRQPSPLFPLISESPRLQAFPGHLVALPKDRLAEVRMELNVEQLALVEDGLCEILGLAYLCRDIPRQPPSVPGTVDYPRWGEIYYVRKLVDNQYKRSVMVSVNPWNQLAAGAIGVRTTTGQASRGLEFPAVQDGKARAVCGAATYLPTKAYVTDGAQRPWPQRLNLADMASVARGLVSTHQLQGAVSRTIDHST